MKVAWLISLSLLVIYVSAMGSREGGYWSQLEFQEKFKEAFPGGALQGINLTVDPDGNGWSVMDGVVTCATPSGLVYNLSREGGFGVVQLGEKPPVADAEDEEEWNGDRINKRGTPQANVVLEEQDPHGQWKSLPRARSENLVGGRPQDDSEVGDEDFVDSWREVIDKVSQQWRNSITANRDRPVVHVPGAGKRLIVSGFFPGDVHTMTSADGGEATVVFDPHDEAIVGVKGKMRVSLGEEGGPYITLEPGERCNAGLNKLYNF